MTHLRVESFDVEIGDEELDGLLVDLVLAHLTELNDVTQERRVGHTCQTVRLEGSLEEVHLFFRDVELELLHRQRLSQDETRTGLRRINAKIGDSCQHLGRDSIRN